MDRTERKITKIERFSHQYTTGRLGNIGLGPSEYEFIHFVRHHQGTSQAQIAEVLKQDKAAIARRAKNLEKKGFIKILPSETDGRSNMIYSTELAEIVKQSKTEVEAQFYEWLTKDVSEERYTVFLEVLDELYRKGKASRKLGFSDIEVVVKED